DEIQDEELKKLQKLEKERLRRMQALDPTIPKHRSADELTDGYELTENVPILSYKEDGQLHKESDEDSSGDEEETAEAEEEEDSDEGSESDAFSDLLTDDEDQSPDKISKKSSKVRERLDDSKETKILENDDIPYVLNIPKSYEGFRKLMKKYQAIVKDGERFVVRFKIVTERLVKYSLLADKTRLPDLFVYLLRMIIENLEESPHLSENVQKILDISSAQLHTMLLSNPSKCVELYEGESYIQTFLSNKNNKLSIAKIAFYKVCSQIFCVTDFCHRVLSPIKVDMLEIIHSFSANSYMGLLKVLAIVDVIYELSKDSKRYCPEVMRLLLDVLEAVSLPIEQVKFKRRRLEFLRISPPQTKNLSWSDCKPDLSDVEEVVLDGSEVLSLLLRTFDLISQFIQIQHKTRPFFNLTYKCIKSEELVLKLDWANVDFHEVLFSKKLSSTIALPQEATVEDEVPSSMIDRPKMLRLYEPLVEENFDGSRKRKLKRKGQTQEEARLSHKVKKEMKSAVREIIKDNAFLAKQQMKEQATKDAERNRRVKELLGSLSNQEGDFRKLKKQKKDK
ncbi:Nucleolar protein 14, partial [Orchesella cincta]